jgi:predicted  nucleic acid-binding Zn-ribbon protein
VNSTLRTLVDLQKIDSVILELQRQIDEFPILIQRLDQQQEEHEASLAALQTRLTEQEKLRRSKELDVESRNDQVKKYQNQLLQVKTNKEYSALLNEISGLKTKNDLAEEDILELMESIERAKKAITETEKEVEVEKKNIAEIKRQKGSEQDDLQTELKQHQAERDQMAVTIDEKVLKEYTKLLQLRNGIAVSSVGEGGVCWGCHVAVTPQMFAEIKGKEMLHRCPTCFRFLYWAGEQEDAEEAEK